MNEALLPFDELILLLLFGNLALQTACIWLIHEDRQERERERERERGAGK